MKNIIVILILTISPILAQCDWNDDDQVDVLDVVATVDCIMSACWDNIGATVTDIDGNVYETITIGDQIWMAENLKVTHYNNGDPIPLEISNSDWMNLTTGAYSVYPWDYDDQSLATCYGDCSEIYGNIYNGPSIADENLEICPDGFHIPSDEEWMELEMYLGMSFEESQDYGFRGTDQGSQIAGNFNWWYSSGLLENNPMFGSSGFLALPGGWRDAVGGYGGMGLSGYFWSPSGTGGNEWRRRISWNDSGVDRGSAYRPSGFSVRCVGDAD